MIFNDEKQQDQQGQGGSKQQCCNNKREFAHGSPQVGLIRRPKNAVHFQANAAHSPLQDSSGRSGLIRD
jgi:hypothetical protein